MMNFKVFFNKLVKTSGTNRLVLNTFIIYTQKFLTALIALITTPLILKALGVQDYGIYTLTLGLVGMLAFLNWSLSSATQRFLAYAIGERRTDKLKKIFTSSMVIHGIYGIILFLLISILGTLFIDKLLDIPASRIDAAKTILVFISLITFINIVTVPLTGLYRAHENFLYIAFLGIAESLLKLGIAVSLLYISSDKLIFYSVLLLGVAVTTFLANLLFGIKLYPEINFNLRNLSKSLIKDMLSFIGWNLIGALAIMSRNQAVSVLLNIFFGVIKNAAYGIALQVNAAVVILSQGIIAAINPRIVKLAGAGDNEKMIYLMRTMSKMAVLAVSIVILPFLFEASFILKLWLRNVPESAVLFSKLILAFGLIQLQSAGIQIVFEAIGKVKTYNILVSLILILNIPISYILFKLNFPSYSIILVGMALEICSLFVRLFLLKRYLKFSIPNFLNDVFIRIAAPMLITSSFVYILRSFDGSNLQHLITTCLVFFTVYPITIYYLSLDKLQKDFFIKAVQSVMQTIQSK